MTYIYNNNFLNKLKSKKQLHLSIVVSIFLLMIISNAILIVIYADKPVGSNLRNTFQLITYLITVILIFIAGLYYEIFYVPLKKYYLKLVECLLGKKQVSDVTVLCIYNEISDKSSVKFKRLDVLEWSEIQNDYTHREIYFDANIELEFQDNQMVKILTCGNMLLGYEVK